ncbi:hypothetical protein RIR_e34611_A0A2I1FML7_9GLOM [Rhizophagus irregularis DAOM 181602=DAOM 197198]|nr:hypothetical protein RIR_e34611_A0A2I1FML7_9GLOM [Rhizophagus irregularis DAOM 181602=DAOM 197198]
MMMELGPLDLFNYFSLDLRKSLDLFIG